MSHQILLGDCRDRLKELPDNSIDSIVTDPPYELGFMGKSWDASGVAYDVTVWQECLRVLKPGGHLLAFGGSRTYHRMACAIEDAGFQIRDQIMWVYGSGFPKSLNISKAIDKAAGAERDRVPYKGGIASGSGNYGGGGQIHVGTKDGSIPVTAEAEVWDGWGTALKPAHEPIVLARKPLVGTVANNVLKYGVGGINIDGCRVGDELMVNPSGSTNPRIAMGNGWREDAQPTVANGRFPANFIHDGSDEVLELFPSDKPNQSAARFFYCAKASKKDRNEGLDDFEPVAGIRTNAPRPNEEVKTPQRANHHPTVKPTDLMRYLCRLITPSNGTVLDPFTGSGSTGKAAVLEGFSFIGVEQSEEYIAIAEARIQSAKEDK